MKFVFTDKKINLPNKVHAYAEKKVGKLDRYFKADAEAAIVFSVEKDRNNVELTIRSGGTIIRVAEEKAKAMVSQDEIVRQAQQKANELIAQAQQKFKEMRKASSDYVEDLMRRADESLSENLAELRKTRQSIKTSQRNSQL